MTPRPRFLEIFLVLLSHALLRVQAIIDRITGIPLPLGLGLDISITAANVLASSTATVSKQYNFGATVTAGQAVYLDSSNEWVLLDLNAAATGNGITDTRGIALNGGSDGQPAAVVIEDSDFTVGGTLTNGSAVYGSTTAGGVTHDVPATGAYPVYLGQAKSTSKMVLKINASGVVI